MDLDACDRDAKMYCIMGMTFLEINKGKSPWRTKCLELIIHIYYLKGDKYDL